MKFCRLKNSRDDINPVRRQVPRVVVLKAPLLASKKAFPRALDKLFRMYQTRERSKRESVGRRARCFWSNMVWELEQRDTLENPKVLCANMGVYFFRSLAKLWFWSKMNFQKRRCVNNIIRLDQKVRFSVLLRLLFRTFLCRSWTYYSKIEVKWLFLNVVFEKIDAFVSHWHKFFFW